MLRGALAAAGASAAGAAGVAGPARGQGLTAQAERAERVFEVIREYDAQGEHRTGSVADDTCAGWLTRELAGCGLSAKFERFDFTLFSPRRADVLVGVSRRHGVPAFDGGTTGPQGVRGRLGMLGTNAEIAIARIAPSPRGAALEAFEAARRSGKHRAIIVVPERGSSHGDLALINAERFSAPDSTPVVQLAGSHVSALEEAAAAGETCRVIVEADRVPASSVNVTARLRGSEPELAPLVVMTPRSGWFTCASERGGGLAAWLEIARSLDEAPPRRDVLFVASSGHELGHLGLLAYLEWHKATATGAHAWLHLGANLAANGGELIVQASSGEYAELARAALAGQGRAPNSVAPPGTPPLGEAREIATRPFISILGTNRLFHSPDDRFPYAVDLEKTAAIVTALVEVATKLAS